MVANVISRFRTLGLYQDNSNEDVPPTVDDDVKNIIEEVHSTNIVPRRPVYNMGKLNLDVLRKDQQWDQFCKKQGQIDESETRP